MQKILPNVYYFVDTFNLSDLLKLSRNLNIIYRNYNSFDHFKNLTKLKSFCKKNKNKLYLSNDIKLALKLGLNGVYLPSFNNQLNYAGKYSLPKNFKIIGSAHNLKEIRIKEAQQCSEIFLSPLFLTKNYQKCLGIIKFNLLSMNSKKKIVALGGIRKENLKKISLLKIISGIAGITLFKKKAPEGAF
jgi:thiamine-phosphate pyrophosphorylase